MSEYGAAQNTPYSGQQQDADLVHNSRYQGQAGGTTPLGHDGRGPQDESRYGAAPLSTGAGNNTNTTPFSHGKDPVETIRNPAAYGFQKHEPEGFRFPGTTGASQQQQQRHNNTPASEFAREQPGYGQPGFGAPSQGQNTSSLWPSPAAPPNARRSDDLVGGYGDGVHGQQQQPTGVVDKIKNAVGVGSNTGYEQQGAGYGQGQGAGYNQPRREGIVDKAKDAVGVGPNSGYNQGYGQGQPGYDQPRHGGLNPGSTQDYGQGQSGYDQQPRREGIVDKAKDAVGVGPNSGYNQGYGQGQPGYDQPRHGGLNPGSTQGYGQGQPGYDQQPRREGIVDKAKDAVGVGPNTGRPYDSTPGGTRTGTGEYNPNVNRQNEERGFGGGLGYDQSNELGDGYNTGIATGADAYGQNQQYPRREGLGDKVKDAVGRGPHSGYDDRTRTGNDAYVHGNHPPGLQDRIQGVNEPTILGGQHGVHAGLGGRDGVLGEGEHVPESLLGERRTEPGYDTSKGHIASHLPGHEGQHHKLGGTGLNSDPTDIDYDERRGREHDHGIIGTGTHGHDGANKFGTGTDSHDPTRTGTDSYDPTRTGTDSYDPTRTGTDSYDPTRTGTDSYDPTGTGSETGYDDAQGSGTAPPKKGLITKIKEKLHH